MRANFITVSMDSLPEHVKNTRASAIGASWRICSARASAGSLVNGSNVL